MDEFERIMIGKKISFEVSTEEADWHNQHTRRVKAKVKESQNGIIMAEDMDILERADMYVRQLDG